VTLFTNGGRAGVTRLRNTRPSRSSAQFPKVPRVPSCKRRRKRHVIERRGAGGEPRTLDLGMLPGLGGIRDCCEDWSAQGLVRSIRIPRKLALWDIKLGITGVAAD
jgi:hypothetical protein